MQCSECSADITENTICKKCCEKQLLQKLEEFLDTNYPANQYKTFNSRIKARFKKLLEEG